MIGKSTKEHLHPWNERQSSRALGAKAVCLIELRRYGDAINACKNVVLRFSGSVDPEIQIIVAKTILNKGEVLGRLSRYQEAVEECDNVLRLYADRGESEFQELRARALSKSAKFFGEVDRS